MDSMDKYLKGLELYGDDFSEHEIREWYKEEEEAYAALIKDKKLDYSYTYHNMNQSYGFKYIESIPQFKNALGFGSAFGYEFMPIISKIQNLTIVEPSDYLQSPKLGHLVPKYIKPNIDGFLEFPDNSFDLITCLGALHHIPNVSFVLSEIIRVLEKNGILLLREPIRTMGDWRFCREGLTKNERGIPHIYFDNIFKKNNVEIVKKQFCESLFLSKILGKLFKVNNGTYLYQKIDKFISRILQWNIHYHPNSNIQKLAPGSVFYVVRKHR